MWPISEDDLVDPVTSDLFIRTLFPDPGEEKDRGGEGIGLKKKKKKTAWRDQDHQFCCWAIMIAIWIAIRITIRIATKIDFNVV